jgi:hypothetical protein
VKRHDGLERLLSSQLGTVARTAEHLRYSLSTLDYPAALARLDEPAVLKAYGNTLPFTVSPLLDRVDNLAEFLAMEPDTELEAALMKGQSIGRPLMNDQELLALEQRLGRTIRPGKRGRPSSTES